MIESNSLFTTEECLTLPIPSQQAWDAICSSNPYWNRAFHSFESSLGFHTGSNLRISLNTLNGLDVIHAEVTTSDPFNILVFENTTRIYFLAHREKWEVSFENPKNDVTRIKMRYQISGPFCARIWNKKKIIINNIFNLWLESLRDRVLHPPI